MLSEDRDAVICDLAETYHIYDMAAVPVQTLATLCAGLRDDARIKMRFSEMQHIPDVFMMTRMADALTMILHILTGDKKEPALYQDIVMGKRKKQDDTEGFASPEEFLAARKRFING